MKIVNHPKSFQTLLIFIFLTACALSISAQVTKTNAEYASEIETLMSTSYERGLINGNVLVSKNDEIIYQKSFGYTDATSETELHDKSIFRIGSIVKQFNAVSIMMLHDRKQLDIDDPISKYDLELPSWSEKVTLRHMINYAGGLPVIEPTPMTDQEVWTGLRNKDSLIFEPGTNFNYNNNSVFLQKRIVEKVSGKSFGDFVIENITKPLKMTNSFIDLKPDAKNRTSCFDTEKNPCEEIEYHSGWLWVDAPDFLKWIEAMNANVLISRASFDILLHNPYAPSKTASNGDFLKEYNTQRHDGSANKFRSIMYNDFTNNIIVIVMSNDGNEGKYLGSLVYDLMSNRPYIIPKKSVVQVVEKDFLESYELGIKSYDSLKKTNGDEYGFDDPSELNNLGYTLLRANKNEDAIKVFILATKEFPTNANSYDSLGEGYFYTKQYDLALFNYNKVIEIGGPNENAEMMIEKIKAEK